MNLNNPTKKQTKSKATEPMPLKAGQFLLNKINTC